MMERLRLVRFAENADSTFGVLVYRGEPLVVTLEPLWRNNKKNVSSIPVGYYTCKKFTSKKFGETFKVLNVKDRTGIVFHRGNTFEDTRGCILLGSRHGSLGETPGVLSSDAGFKKFYRRMRNETIFDLEIIDVVSS